MTDALSADHPGRKATPNLRDRHLNNTEKPLGSSKHVIFLNSEAEILNNPLVYCDILSIYNLTEFAKQSVLDGGHQAPQTGARSDQVGKATSPTKA